MSGEPLIDGPTWGFYGRRKELDELRDLFERPRWFLLRVSGRRRIGKTALVRRALAEAGRDRVAYVQIDDTDAAGVVASARRHLAMSGVPEEQLPVDLLTLAARIADLAAEGWVVVLDEFQYFHRKALSAFPSFLQFEVDRFRLGERPASGGVVLLGSIHTEMVALLEDRRAPLFGRATRALDLDHLDVDAIVRILDVHADRAPERLLFLWTLFQGIPKYWQDAWETGVLGADRPTTLERLFFDSSAPLRTEGSGWLVDELRGRYDLFLRFIASHPGCSRADIVAHATSVKGYGDAQPGFYLGALEERFRIVERRDPVFSPHKTRRGRYYLSDNFLQAWLGALADPVAFVGIRETPGLVAEADARLAVAEGTALERLTAALYAYRSRHGLGDFALTDFVHGWWDRTGTEIDLVAVDAQSRRVRLVSCKRSADRLVADLGRFEGHIARFLAGMPRFAGWTVEKVAVAPRLEPQHRRAAGSAGYLPQDLVDLTMGLGA